MVLKQLKVMSDERGWLMEILRCDEALFERFGQVYLTTAYPGVVKAWHGHERQVDHVTCIRGMIKVVLWDGREGSSTAGEVNEFFLGEYQPLLIKIPSMVYHGFKAVGPETAYVINVPDRPYNRTRPDELRLPPDTDRIPHKWVLTPGKRHG